MFDSIPARAINTAAVPWPRSMRMSVSSRLRLLLVALALILVCSAALLSIDGRDHAADRLVYQRVERTLGDTHIATTAKDSLVKLRRVLVLAVTDATASHSPGAARAAMQGVIDHERAGLAADAMALETIDAPSALRFRTAVEGLNAAALDGVAAFAAGDAAAGSQAFRRFPQLGAPAEDALGALRSRQQQELRLILGAAESRRAHSQQLARVLHGTLLLLATVTALLLLHTIFRPMQRLYEALRSIGRGVPLEASPVAGSDEFGQFGLALHELSQRSTRLSRLAYHDELTGLPNRTQFERDLAGGIEGGRDLAVVFADIDHFRTINDGYGHPFGDEVLKAVASRLEWLMRGESRLYRYSGDLFAVLLEAGDGEATHFRTMVATEGERLRTHMSEALNVQGRSLTICLSLGVALYPDDGRQSEVLISAADAAMFHAKQQGRNVLHFAQRDSALKARQRLEMADELRLALKAGAVVPYFQPIVDLGSGQIVCAEALARWQHPVRGFVPPDEFIGIAEASGQIDLLTEQLLRQACATAVRWQALHGRSIPRLAFNLSARQVRQGLVEMIANVLAETGLPASRLEIEITESAIIERPETAERLLGELRQLGVSVALDDFGTGYSSLSYLLRFPIDKIKVDRSFVAQLNGQKQAGKIVAATISLASNLDMLLVAEGVENVLQMNTLYELGCRQQQGWLFSKALPPEEFMHWAAHAPLKLDAISLAHGSAANEMQPAA